MKNKKEIKSDDRDRREYAKVVRHFLGRGASPSTTSSSWKKLENQGLEGTVYVDEQMTKVLKKVPVSLAEDPISRFEALERVNRKASASGICPRVLDVYYEVNGCGVLQFCIVSHYFDGRAFSELPKRDRRKVMPQVEALVAKMLRCKVWHNDLHGDNILVSPGLDEVTFIDFGNGAFVMETALSPLALRKIHDDVPLK